MKTKNWKLLLKRDRRKIMEASDWKLESCGKILSGQIYM